MRGHYSVDEGQPLHLAQDFKRQIVDLFIPINLDRIISDCILSTFHNSICLDVLQIKEIKQGKSLRRCWGKNGTTGSAKMLHVHWLQFFGDLNPAGMRTGILSTCQPGINANGFIPAISPI